MNIELTDEELVLLDGKVSAGVQEHIEQSKARIAMANQLQGLPPKHAKFIADVVAEAQKSGELCFQHCNLRSCGLCGASAGYAQHKRSGRYHRAGQPNYDKPLFLSGKELARRFVVMRGYAALGCCNVCFELVAPHLRTALADVRAEIPESLTGKPPRFKRFNNVKCECGFTGHEGQLGKLPALMGGFYPGKCPKCGAENLLFGKSFIKRIDGFAVEPMNKEDTKL